MKPYSHYCRGCGKMLDTPTCTNWLKGKCDRPDVITMGEAANQVRELMHDPQQMEREQLEWEKKQARGGY